MREELAEILNKYLERQGIELTEEKYEQALTLIETDIRNRLDEFAVSYYVHEVITNG
jgi:DNA polymerase III delta prime subunit